MLLKKAVLPGINYTHVSFHWNIHVLLGETLGPCATLKFHLWFCKSHTHNGAARAPLNDLLI